MPKDPSQLQRYEYKKGQSGNPAGKPKGTYSGPLACIRSLLRQMAPDKAVAAFKTYGYDINSPSNADILAIVLLEKAINGDIAAIKEVYAQVESPLKQTIEHDVSSDTIQLIAGIRKIIGGEAGE